MKGFLRRAMALAIAVVLAAGLMPASVEAKAYISYTRNRDASNLYAGRSSSSDVGTVTVKGGTGDESVHYSVYGVYRRQNSDAEYALDDASALISSDGTVTVSIGTGTPAGTYYILIDAKIDDVESDIWAPFSVVADKSNKRISSVSVEMPTGIKEGEYLYKYLNEVKADNKNDIYTNGTTELYTFDKDGKSISNDSVAVKGRTYRLVVTFTAIDEWRFVFNSTKSRIWDDYYTYNGSVSSNMSYEGAAVENGIFLYVAFDYPVIPKDGSDDGTGTVVESTGIPSEKPTISVSGNASTTVTYSTSGNVATIDNIPADIAAATVGSKAVPVSFNLSNQGSRINTVNFNYASFSRLTDAITGSGSASTGLEVRLPGADALFNGKALQSISRQADGRSVKVSVSNISLESLTGTQKSALAGMEMLGAVRAGVNVGKLTVNDFEGGLETISIPYIVPTGKSSSKIGVFYIDDNGKLYKQPTSYSNGRIIFSTDHNSDFVVLYDGKGEDSVPTAPIYRAYNRANGDHLLTADRNEYNQVTGAGGWDAEGEAFRVSTFSGKDVYRLYNLSTGEHFYTANSAERDSSVRAGWVDEGAHFKSSGSRAVYRVYNPNQKANNHLFTTSQAEKDKLVKAGWNDEGVVFYVQ